MFILQTEISTVLNIFGKSLANENTTKNKDSEILLLTSSHIILQKEIDANFLEINNFHMDSSNQSNEEMNASSNSPDLRIQANPVCIA